VFADKQPSRIGDTFIKTFASFFVEESCLCLFQAVECVRCERVLGFVGVDEEGLFAVLEFDV
jgi:hypothetical protein